MNIRTVFFQTLASIVFVSGFASGLNLQFGGELTVSNNDLWWDRQCRYNVFSPEQSVAERNALTKESHRNFFGSPIFRCAVERIQNHWRSRLDSSQFILSATETHRDVRFRAQRNTFHVDLGVDQGVLEYSIGPNELDHFEQYATDYQDLIFESADTQGLYPMLFLGGGHISIGYTSFRNDRELMKRFLLDFIGHYELSMGILDYNVRSSLSHWLLPDDCRSAVFDRLNHLNTDPDYPEAQFISDLKFVLQPNCVDRFLDTSEYASRGKYMSITFRDDAPDTENWRFEIRGVRPQKGFQVFLNQIRLLQARINYLRHYIPPELTSKWPREMAFQPGDQLYLNPPITREVAISRFKDYIKPTGLRWQDQIEYVWPRWDCSQILSADALQAHSNRHKY